MLQVKLWHPEEVCLNFRRYSRTAIDQHLRDINDDYATERDNVLRAPQIEIISPKIFLDYFASKGKIGGQAKFPRVMKKDQFADWEAFVAAKMSKIA